MTEEGTLHSLSESWNTASQHAEKAMSVGKVVEPRNTPFTETPFYGGPRYHLFDSHRDVLAVLAWLVWLLGPRPQPTTASRHKRFAAHTVALTHGGWAIALSPSRRRYPARFRESRPDLRRWTRRGVFLRRGVVITSTVIGRPVPRTSYGPSWRWKRPPALFDDRRPF